jgi:hypothetical protein
MITWSVTYGTPTWTWCVVVHGALYVRAYSPEILRGKITQNLPTGWLTAAS